MLVGTKKNILPVIKHAAKACAVVDGLFIDKQITRIVTVETTIGAWGFSSPCLRDTR